MLLGAQPNAIRRCAELFRPQRDPEPVQRSAKLAKRLIGFSTKRYCCSDGEGAECEFLGTCRVEAIDCWNAANEVACWFGRQDLHNESPLKLPSVGNAGHNTDRSGDKDDLESYPDAGLRLGRDRDNQPS